jgi:hypothetical protein
VDILGGFIGRAFDKLANKRENGVSNDISFPCKTFIAVMS